MLRRRTGSEEMSTGGAYDFRPHSGTVRGGTTHTLKRNEHRGFRPLSNIVGWCRTPVLTCGNVNRVALCVDVENRPQPHFLRTVCGPLGHVDRPLARAASNSVRATCSAFSVAAAPPGLAS